MNLILYILCLHPDQHGKPVKKKTGVKLELITDYDMLLMIEKGIRGRICEATQKYAKANNKYMKNYDKNNEPLYIKYLDTNNLYGWAMSQKLPVKGFRWVKSVMKIVTKDIFFRQMQSLIIPKELFNFHKDLLFLPE